MVLVSDVKKDFFDLLDGKIILIIVSSNVDSVCAFKIIKELFQCYNIPYTYVIIENKTDAKKSYKNHKNVSNILLINLGGVFDVVEFFEFHEKDEVVIYVLDSQRPIHVNNFYNQNQVKMLTFHEEFDYVPDFDKIYKDDESDESGNESDGDSDSLGENKAKRRRYNKENIDKQIRIKEWREEREDILMEYENVSFYGTCSSLVAYHICEMMEKETLDVLWSAMVGHSYHMTLHLIGRGKYKDSIPLIKSKLDNLLSGKQRPLQNDSYNFESRDREQFTITPLDELSLRLYRHWSFDQALHSTPIIIRTFSNLSKKGLEALNNFMAYIGVPQKQCEQYFSFMDLEIRNSLISLLKEHCEEFGLQKDELFVPSYEARHGYSVSVSALDMVFMIVALLESLHPGEVLTSGIHTRQKHIDISEKFLMAMRLISLKDNELIKKALSLAKDMVDEMGKVAKDVVDNNHVRCQKPFLYIRLNQIKSTRLQTPMKQRLLGNFILNLYCGRKKTLGRNEYTDTMPFIICCEQENKNISMLGLPPLKSDPNKNLFRALFRSSLLNCSDENAQEGFDDCRIEVSERNKFRIFEKIVTLLNVTA